jgi:hypothetical protein
MPQTNRDSVANCYVVAKNRITADYDLAEMFDFESPADSCFTRQFDSGKNLHDCEKYSVEEGERCSDNSVGEAIAPSAEPINSHHPEALTPRVAFVRYPVFS